MAKISKTDSENWEQDAASLAENFKWEEVVQLCGKVLKKNGSNVAAKKKLGNALLHLMKFSEAEKLFREVIAEDYNDAEAWSGLAGALMSSAFASGTKKESEYLGALAKAAELDPENNGYVFAYTFALSSLKKYGEEAEFLEKVLKKKESWSSYLYLGDCYKELNRPEEAGKAYERGGALNPESSSPLMRLGRLAASLGKNGEAKAYYGKALALEVSEKTKKEIEGILKKLGT